VQGRILFSLPVHDSFDRSRSLVGRDLRVTEHTFQHRQWRGAVFNLLPPPVIAVVMTMNDLSTKTTHREGLWIQWPDRVSYLYRGRISVPHIKSINQAFPQRHGYSPLRLKFHLMCDALIIEIMVFRI